MKVQGWQWRLYHGWYGLLWVVLSAIGGLVFGVDMLMFGLGWGLEMFL